MKRVGAASATALVVAIVVGAASAGSQVGGATAPPPTTRGTSLKAILDKLVSTSGAPGGILLVQTSKSTWQRAVGLARKSPRSQMRPTGRFRVGSVTKTFTAALVLTLVADGVLSLEDTVSKWLPGAVPDGDRITIRALLGHRSGLTQVPGFSVPLGSYWYANVNYDLLGQIVSEATHSSLEEELDRRVLGPLGLAQTELRSGPASDSIVHGYLPAGTVDVTAAGTPCEVAACALISTVPELARFERSVLTGKLVPRELVTAMTTPGSLSGYSGADSYDAYGLGMMRFPTKCGKAWGHRGRILGYTTWMLSLANGSRSVIAFVNVGELTRPLTRKTTSLVVRALCI